MCDVLLPPGVNRMCDVLLPPGVNPTAVKYIYHIISLLCFVSFSLRYFVFHFMCYTFQWASRIFSSVWCAMVSVQTTVLCCVCCCVYCARGSVCRIVPGLCDTFVVPCCCIRYTFNSVYGILSVLCATFSKIQKVVSCSSQTPQYIYFSFTSYDMFWSADHHWGTFTNLRIRCMQCT
jgi:hypothetical protein